MRGLRKLYRLGGQGNPNEEELILANNRAKARPIMTDDFYYRLSKTNPQANEESIAKAYDNANMVAPKDYLTTMRLIGGDDNTAAAYVPALTEGQMNLANKRARILGTNNPFSNKHSTLIFGNEFTDDQGISPSAVSHEARHMYDAELGYGINDNNRSILEKAYPNIPEDERLTTNIQLRTDISEANNGVIKEDLDKAMDATSDEDFYKAYKKANGYTKDDDYYYYNPNQPFVDYMKTDDYKSQYLPMIDYMNQQKDFNQKMEMGKYASRGWDDVVTWAYRFHKPLNDATKKEYKELRKFYKENKNNTSATVPTFSETAKEMYEKYGKLSKEELNKKTLDPKKIGFLRDATKNVAYNSGQGFSTPRRRLESYGYETV